MDGSFLQVSAVGAPDYRDRIERMYPDIYHQIMPYIDDVLDNLGDERVENLTEEDINHLVAKIEERFRGGGVNPMGGHGPSAMNDIARILLLGAIANRYSRGSMFYPPFYGYPFFSPFPVMPFFPGHCGRGGCGANRGRGRSRGWGGRRW